MQLFPHLDAYTMLRRTLDPSLPAVFLDVGANAGQTARRMKEIFPNATVHSFEPVGEMFDALSTVAHELTDVHAYRLALGSTSGSIDIHVTEDSQFSSALKAADRGRAYYSNQIRPIRTERVPMVTLDDWARTQGIDRIDVLKVDVQGLELDVLKGARRILSTAVAINCEAQIHPEYTGACTLFEIGIFLREMGFILHQFHDIWEHGPEKQHSCVDALWLREDQLELLRRTPNLEHAFHEHWQSAMRLALLRCAQRNLAPVAIYGAGNHTRVVGPALLHPAAPIACIIDEDSTRAGERIMNIPIKTPKDALAAGIKAVILSTNSVPNETAMFERAKAFCGTGIPVLRLYDGRPAHIAAQVPPHDDVSPQQTGAQKVVRTGTQEVESTVLSARH
jgi:FkbM family methyltransferase